MSALTLLVAACRDAPTDPVVGLVAEEAYAALALGVTFPDPMGWADPGELPLDAAQALQAWQRSWDMPGTSGARAREAAYGPLAAGLAGRLEPDAVERELILLTEGVTRARSLEVDALPAHVDEGIRQAEARVVEAREALVRDDRVEALEALVRGGDALRSVGPEAVARALQTEVETRFGRISGDDPYTDQDLERLRRLVRGGRQAMDEGNWALAIRRAFYARGLMDGNG